MAFLVLAPAVGVCWALYAMATAALGVAGCPKPSRWNYVGDCAPYPMNGYANPDAPLRLRTTVANLVFLVLTGE